MYFAITVAEYCTNGHNIVVIVILFVIVTSVDVVRSVIVTDNSERCSLPPTTPVTGRGGRGAEGQ